MIRTNFALTEGLQRRAKRNPAPTERRRMPLSCVWIETGNPRRPLACVWMEGGEGDSNRAPESPRYRGLFLVSARFQGSEVP